MEYLNWSRQAIRRQAFPFVSHYLAADDLPVIPDSPTALVYSIATSNQEIPRTEDAKRQDKYLSIVEEFLRTADRPLDYSASQIRRLVRYAANFFLFDGKLWRKRPNTRHQLVIPPDHRHSILTQTHDALGHKGVYATRVRLLDRFWWPYVIKILPGSSRTCHICQTRQINKYSFHQSSPHLLVSFGKAYVDTMFMPRVGGFRYVRPS
jgi:hypothetical protein